MYIKAQGFDWDDWKAYLKRRAAHEGKEWDESAWRRWVETAKSEVDSRYPAGYIKRVPIRLSRLETIVGYPDEAKEERRGWEVKWVGAPAPIVIPRFQGAQMEAIMSALIAQHARGKAPQRLSARDAYKLTNGDVRSVRRVVIRANKKMELLVAPMLTWSPSSGVEWNVPADRMIQRSNAAPVKRGRKSGPRK